MAAIGIPRRIARVFIRGCGQRMGEACAAYGLTKTATSLALGLRRRQPMGWLSKLTLLVHLSKRAAEPEGISVERTRYCGKGEDKTRSIESNGFIDSASRVSSWLV